MGLNLRWYRRSGSLTFKSVVGALFAVFVGLLIVVSGVFLRIDFRFVVRG